MALQDSEANTKDFNAAGALAGWLPDLGYCLVLSGFLNVLQLSAPFYAHHIFDNVLPTQNLTLLGAATGLVLLGHASFTLLDYHRTLTLIRTGRAFARRLDRHAFRALGGRAGLEPLGHAERLGRFLTGGGPAAVFDAVWLPIYLGAAFVLNPVLGVFATTGVITLSALSAVAEVAMRAPIDQVVRDGRRRLVLASSVLRSENGASGRTEPASTSARRWHEQSATYFRHQTEASEPAIKHAAFAKGLRLAIQSAGLAIGTLLVINDQLSVGELIASSVLLARTFACVDAALVHWRGLIAARESYTKLAQLLSVQGPEALPERRRVPA